MPTARRGAASPCLPPEASTGPSRAADESRLLRSVVDFGDTLVREVMTPRPDIVAIRADATIDDLRQLVLEQEYSRLPVYAENLDNIVGLVVVKDLIQRPEALASTRQVSEIMRPAAFVPETKRVVDVLREFQQKRFQLAIVVDEYGGTAGLVTVEDVVEELVGEIRDEYDSEAEPIVREGDDCYVFSAKVAIERAGRSARRSKSRTANSRPSAATCCRASGRVPAVGERFTFDGLDVEILEAERRRIHKVRLRRTARPRARSAPNEVGIRRPRRPAERGQVDPAQPLRRREGRDRLRQAADDAPPHRGRPQCRPRARSSSSTRRASTSRCTA